MTYYHQTLLPTLLKLFSLLPIISEGILKYNTIQGIEKQLEREKRTAHEYCAMDGFNKYGF